MVESDRLGYNTTDEPAAAQTWITALDGRNFVGITPSEYRLIWKLKSIRELLIVENDRRRLYTEGVAINNNTFRMRRTSSRTGTISRAQRCNHSWDGTDRGGEYGRSLSIYRDGGRRFSRSYSPTHANFNGMGCLLRCRLGILNGWESSFMVS